MFLLKNYTGKAILLSRKKVNSLCSNILFYEKKRNKILLPDDHENLPDDHENLKLRVAIN